MENTMTRHIEITPGIAGGKPHITGHRITVQNIVIWCERMGMSPDEVVTEHDISLADVFAALTYYHDHRNEIDESIRSDDAFVNELRSQTPSILKEKLGV